MNQIESNASLDFGSFDIQMDEDINRTKKVTSFRSCFSVSKPPIFMEECSIRPYEYDMNPDDNQIGDETEIPFTPNWENTFGFSCRLNRPIPCNSKDFNPFSTNCSTSDLEFEEDASRLLLPDELINSKKYETLQSNNVEDLRASFLSERHPITGKRIPKEVMSLKDELPFGNYSLIFIDIDFFDLKSKLRTEMCQIGAYISNGTSMQGFIKPKDHNMLTHSNFYEVIEGRSYYKNPRDFNMHLMLSQKEVLINFLGFIEKSHDINYFDGVLILSLSDEATPYLLKALKKYDLFRRFEKRVKGIGDLYSHLQVTNPILYSDILVPLFSKIYSKLMGRKENTCLLYSCQHKAMLLEKMTTKFLSGEVPTYSNFYSFVIKPIGSSVLKRAATLETIEERMESCLPLALYISNKLSLFQTFHKKKKKVTRDRIVFDFCRILLDGELDFKMMLKTYSDQGARDLEMKIWSIVLERMNSFSKDVEVYNQIIDVTLEYFHNFCGILVKPKETPKLNFNNNNLSSKLKKVHKASTEILASSNLTNEDLHDTYFKLSSEIKSSRILKYRFKEYLGDKIKASFSKLSNPPFGFSMFLEHMYTLYCIGPTPILTPKIREDFFKFISKYYRSEQGIQIYFKSFKPLEDSIRRSFMPFMSKGLKKKLKYSTRISKCISLILSYESLSLDIIKGYNDHEIFSMILNIFSNHQIPGVAPLYVVNIIRNFLAEGSK